MSSELPPPDPGERSADPDPDSPVATSRRTRSGRNASRRAEPNYAARRAVAIGVVVAVFAVIIGAIVVVFTGGDDDTDLTRPRWDVVVEADRSTGALVVLDRDGVVVDEIDGDGRATALYVREDRVALVGPGRIDLVDLDGSDATSIEIDRAFTVTRLPTQRSMTFVAAPAAPGPLLLIDGRTGEVLDIGDAAGQDAPVLFADSLRTDPEGRAVAIGDGANFQTVVVRFGVDGATFFPGLPMAVGDELVVTSTNVGTSAELGIFAADGDRLATITSDRPVGGVLTDNRYVYATAAGELFSVTPDANAPERLGTVAVPGDDQVRRVSPVLDGQRLVLTGRRFTAIVDLDGEIVYQTTSTADLDPAAPWTTWRCLPVGGGDRYHALVDLDDGATLADLSVGTVESVSLDGCSVHLAGIDPAALDTDTDGDTAATIDAAIVSADGTSPVPPGARAVHLAPDGAAVVIVAADGRAALVPVSPGITLGDDPDVEVVDLGVRRGLLAFGHR